MKKKAMIDKDEILSDSRRLTGHNLLCDLPAVVLELQLESSETLESLAKLWEEYVYKMTPIFEWNDSTIFKRFYKNGASLGFTAPFDILYSVIEVNEYCLELAINDYNGNHKDIDPEKIKEFEELIANEAFPSWHLMQQEAEANNVAFLWDDDFVSVGLGKGSITWEADKVPHPSEVDWDKVHDIPIILVTGTNGKSTTVRLTASIAKAAGYTPGVTSTDFLKVGDKVIDKGDYSGPGGARQILRHHDVDLAVLEVARGGMLRRGLSVSKANVAIVTNVADDHLGEYGIDTLDDLCEAKFVVAKAIDHSGQLIVNADDTRCTDYALTLNKNLTFFGSNPQNQRLIASGNYLTKDSLFLENKKIIDNADIPIAFDGFSSYNLMNSLAAACLSSALQISNDHICEGLRNFKSDYHNNPGRGNVFSVNGVKIVLDFAHNEHAMDALVKMSLNYPAKRRLVLIGQAGDRSDEHIEKYALSALKMNPDKVIIPEVENYLRGREKGVVPALFAKTFLSNGLSDHQVSLASSNVEATKMALEWSQSGDLLIMIILDEKDEVVELITNDK